MPDNAPTPKPKISAEIVLVDIRSGMRDVDLMSKYQLSARGLQSLFQKLLDANLISRAELGSRSPIRDAQSSVGSQDRPAPAKQVLKARDVVKDLRSGFTDAELMEKYELSYPSMQHILKRLVDAKIITQEEIDHRPQPEDDTFQMAADYRSLTRYEVDIPLPVYESDFPETRGRVRDMTERGVGISGIDTRVGDRKVLLIPAHEFLGVDGVEFEAICRWSMRVGIAQECFSGFEITQYLRGSMRDLEYVLRAIPLEDRIAIKKKHPL